MTEHNAPVTRGASARVVVQLRPRRASVRAGAVKLCPTCRDQLDGGPVVFRCNPCGKAVYAADLVTEYRQPAADSARAAA